MEEEPFRRGIAPWARQEQELPKDRVACVERHGPIGRHPLRLVGRARYHPLAICVGRGTGRRTQRLEAFEDDHLTCRFSYHLVFSGIPCVAP